MDWKTHSSPFEVQRQGALKPRDRAPAKKCCRTHPSSCPRLAVFSAEERQVLRRRVQACGDHVFTGPAGFWTLSFRVRGFRVNGYWWISSSKQRHAPARSPSKSIRFAALLKVLGTSDPMYSRRSSCSRSSSSISSSSRRRSIVVVVYSGNSRSSSSSSCRRRRRARRRRCSGSNQQQQQ